MYTYAHAYTHAYIRIHTHIKIYIYTYKHTHINIYIYTYIQSQRATPGKPHLLLPLAVEIESSLALSNTLSQVWGGYGH